MGVDALTRLEKIPTRICKTSKEAVQWVAYEIAQLIRTRSQERKPCVLGLATGSTPRGIYEELIRIHREEHLSFSNVHTFNLDEYYPIRRDDPQSYWHFMHQYFFQHVDIPASHIHLLNGEIPVPEVQAHCEEYEQEIDGLGGIDIQILGIGRSGHIGFNEPGSSRTSRTRLIHLDKITRIDASSDFFGEEYVPRRALTMGIDTILKARKIFLLAFGEHKAEIIAKAIEGPITPNVPASFLQEHPNTLILLDPSASARLTRVQSPWLLGDIPWDFPTIRKAVIWLARQVDKPILKLTDEDYNEHGLQGLLADRGPAYDINIEVFRSLQETITGWPGGKPAPARRPGDRRRTTDEIFPKRILVFSPHPDDDVISMGGTLIRLGQQGHEVHTVYQTSGSIAVFDSDALRFAQFVEEFSLLFGMDSAVSSAIHRRIEKFLLEKKPGQPDTNDIILIKQLIRKSEAIAACRYCGIPLDRVHFLNMPFYETGRVTKQPLSEKDISLILEILQEVKPHQIYAAGDLSDPHGTHRVCLTALLQALRRVKEEPWYSSCEVWLYRGAWQEWGPEEIEMAVPLSPQELLKKRYAIFKHQSQKDKALFPGHDQREFWQRAEHRNRETARLYDKLGLAEYEAIEGFVRTSSIPELWEETP
ncbi:MAG: glucosamine-6-phosphate deaminase [Spirochaetes bacterium]|nr:glucosamine-6-phosphate deaminase [Spirochaetota bacterium]